MERSPDPALTRWSIVLAAGAGGAAGREALAWLCRQYWDVLGRHARRRGWGDDTEDVVQDFFAQLIERGALATVDPARGRFRSWLLTCLDHFLATRAEALATAKRGGGRRPTALPMDETPGAPADPAQEFDRDWALTLLARAEDRLAAKQADPVRFAALRPFLIKPGEATAYHAVGAALGLGEGAVKVAVHRLRTQLGELIRAEVADSLAESDPRLVDHELDHLIAALADRS